jgi:signal transduction histidine kinase
MTLDLGGKARYLTGACTDVTERAKAIESERKARADAERAARMRDEVLAVVAHDLRNPVHTISMSAAVLAMNPSPPDDRRAKQVDMITRAAKGMDLLIRDLLDVAQIQMGQLAINKAPVAIAPLANDVAASYAVATARVGLQIITDVAAGLPMVPCDHARIAQVLHNLIGNAIKFTDRGGIITISARDCGDRVELSVSDTGRGIAAADVPRVFERYWQGDRGTAHGVGLGLAIVRGIVDAHGGAVGVESMIGKGSTFTLTLPVA